jgi:hypothetical protein
MIIINQFIIKVQKIRNGIAVENEGKDANDNCQKMFIPPSEKGRLRFIHRL